MDKELLTHIIDIKETLGGHTEAIENIKDNVAEIQAQCPVWDIKEDVETLKNDRKWYSKIIGVVGGFIGAVTVVVIEWLFHRSK